MRRIPFTKMSGAGNDFVLIDAGRLGRPGADEINDGVDNQCPGDAGAGLVDELAEDAVFAGPDTLVWTPQPGATLYEVARADAPDFGTGCVVLAAPPAGKALVITRIHIPWDIAGSTGDLLTSVWRDSGCSSSLVDRAISGHGSFNCQDKDCMLDLSYEPGLGIAPGQALYTKSTVGSSNRSKAISAFGYITDS